MNERVSAQAKAVHIGGDRKELAFFESSLDISFRRGGDGLLWCLLLFTKASYPQVGICNKSVGGPSLGQSISICLLFLKSPRVFRTMTPCRFLALTAHSPVHHEIEA